MRQKPIKTIIAPINTDQELFIEEVKIPKSKPLKYLSEPYITDGGRTIVYFKKGSDVQERGRQFEASRERRITR